MYLTGFADEASVDLKKQIQATQELGWHFIECRCINGKMLGTMTDAEFDTVCETLEGTGVTFNCYGSGIANWSKHPRKEEDFEASKNELLTAIPRMKKLGIKMLRGMSFLVPKDEVPDSPELEEIIFRKVRELVKICEDHDVLYLHENCMNYGGLSYLHTLKLLDHIPSPNLKLVFDTGNPTVNERHIGTPPYPMQSSWEFYRAVREFVAYVHIKDATATHDEPKAIFTWAGEGCGDVRAIMIDLLKNGYDGGISIEPHVFHVFHDPNASKEANEKIGYESYVEYGKRFEKLLRECGWKW